MKIHFLPIEIILTVFALFAWSRVYIKFRARSMNNKEFIFWTLIWASAIIIVFIPKKTTVLARILGMERGFDAMVFIAIIMLFYVVYRLYAKANENDQTITELVRKIALKGAISVKRKAKKVKEKEKTKKIKSV